MYFVTETPQSKILVVTPDCRKYFTVDGRLVEFSSKGIAVLDKNAKIAVCKLSHFVQHQIRLVKTRQSLHCDATIERYGLGQPIGVDEEEILLASLETLELL